MGESINSKQEAIEGIVNKRLKDLCDFLEEMKEGTVRQAKGLWVMKRVHLSEHPVNYYFRTAIDAGVIDVDASGHFTFKHNPFKIAVVKPAAGQKPHRETNAAKIDRMMKEEERKRKLDEVSEKTLAQMTSTGFCYSGEKYCKGLEEYGRPISKGCKGCQVYDHWRQKHDETDDLQGQEASEA